ncbi:N/A [soil metagenome]
MNTNPTAEWTVMIYMNAEPDGFDFSLKKTLKEISLTGSSDKINIITLIDRNPRKTNIVKDRENGYSLPSIFRIEKNKKIRIDTSSLKKIKNDELGSPRVLKEFLDFCEQNFPANKFMLCFWDHGACNALFASPDPGSPNGGTQNFLYITEVSKAIKNSKIKKVDIITFDACCMQMLENAYTLKDSTDFMVGSENLISMEGLGYYMFFKYLNNAPQLSPEEVARLLIKSSYLKVTDKTDNEDKKDIDKKIPGNAEALEKLYYNKIFDDKTFTLSCLRLKNLEVLIEKIDKLAKALVQFQDDELFKYIRYSRFLCQSFYDEDEPPMYNSKTIDFIYFLKKLLDTKFERGDKTEFTGILELANQIIEYTEMNFIAYREISPYMREESVKAKKWGAQGFSMFFPEFPFEWKSYKKIGGWYSKVGGQTRMPFVNDTTWGKFFERYFDYVERSIADSW